MDGEVAIKYTGCYRRERSLNRIGRHGVGSEPDRLIVCSAVNVALVGLERAPWHVE